MRPGLGSLVTEPVADELLRVPAVLVLVPAPYWLRLPAKVGGFGMLAAAEAACFVLAVYLDYPDLGLAALHPA